MRGEKEGEKHTNCAQIQRESRRAKGTSFAAAGNGGDAQWAGGECEWERRSLCVGGSILHHLARDIHGHAFGPGQR